MVLILISFLAGILTILAPCVFTLLPIILSGSGYSKSKFRPLIIAFSLAFSVIIFTLLLKVTTVFIDIEPRVWGYISGSLVVILGILMIFPNWWDKISFRLGLSSKSDQLLHKSEKIGGFLEPFLSGFALGPVFNSCSPTYLFLISTVIVENFYYGLLNILSYSLGLALVLILIGYTGQALVSKLKFAANPNGLFKKILGFVFILVGIFIFSGLDKVVETQFLLTTSNDYNNVIYKIQRFEENLRK